MHRRIADKQHNNKRRVKELEQLLKIAEVRSQMFQSNVNAPRKVAQVLAIFTWSRKAVCEKENCSGNKIDKALQNDNGE